MDEDEEIDIGDGIKYNHIPSSGEAPSSQEVSHEDDEDDERVKEDIHSDSDIFGQFNRTPPSDPFVKHVTYMPNGMPFFSDSETREEHKILAEGNHKVVKIQEIINELNYYRFEIGDTECLKQLLAVTKPLIRGDRRAKACWRHLAKRCPGLDPYEDF